MIAVEQIAPYPIETYIIVHIISFFTANFYLPSNTSMSFISLCVPVCILSEYKTCWTMVFIALNFDRLIHKQVDVILLLTKRSDMKYI